jgi:hypothetical protein
MQKSSLGQDGLEVSAIGPGCMGMSSATVLPAIGGNDHPLPNRRGAVSGSSTPLRFTPFCEQRAGQ